ncbi:MAG TPA: 1-acyl-sn-glycerol-3-phosphate acyltransferase [Aeromicrobium sp.]|nr:1-acyl-sn-glycerol-3-phosphate acyltransferase [Aeromicrobium sp.]
MRILRSVAGIYWFFSRWTYKSGPAPTGSGIMVAAPHTSNWDFILMLAVAWRSGLRPYFLGKKELFRGPMGPVMRAFGGIAVDRQNPAGLVDELIARANSDELFQLVITPEGTRKKVDRWKSGFYRLAMDSNLPVTLAYCDRTTMTSGLGPTITLTGNVKADMDIMRDFFADKAGVKPANRCDPILADESGLA